MPWECRLLTGFYCRLGRVSKGDEFCRHPDYLKDLVHGTVAFTKGRIWCSYVSAIIVAAILTGGVGGVGEKWIRAQEVQLDWGHS